MYTNYSKIEGFEDLKNSIVLRVLKKDKDRSFIRRSFEKDENGEIDSAFKERRYIIKDASNATITFSDDGKKLAIFSEHGTIVKKRNILIAQITEEHAEKKEIFNFVT